MGAHKVDYIRNAWSTEVKRRVLSDIFKGADITGHFGEDGTPIPVPTVRQWLFQATKAHGEDDARLLVSWKSHVKRDFVPTVKMRAFADKMYGLLHKGKLNLSKEISPNLVLGATLTPPTRQPKPANHAVMEAVVKRQPKEEEPPPDMKGLIQALDSKAAQELGGHPRIEPAPAADINQRMRDIIAAAEERPTRPAPIKNVIPLTDEDVRGFPFNVGAPHTPAEIERDAMDPRYSADGRWVTREAHQMALDTASRSYNAVSGRCRGLELEKAKLTQELAWRNQQVMELLDKVMKRETLDSASKKDT